MINDKIFYVWQKEYSEWFINYLKLELKKQWLNNKTYDLVKLFQLIQFDNLELYLWNKYWVEFIREIWDLLKL